MDGLKRVFSLSLARFMSRREGQMGRFDWMNFEIWSGRDFWEMIFDRMREKKQKGFMNRGRFSSKIDGPTWNWRNAHSVQWIFHSIGRFMAEKFRK